MVSGKIGQARDKEGSVSFQNSLRGDRLLVLVDTLRVLDGSVRYRRGLRIWPRRGLRSTR